MTNMHSLKKKIVFVTGASAGIGEACAHAFGRAGARLILAARRRERLEELKAKLPETETHLLPLDVRRAGEVQRAIGQLPAEWQAIDVLVNNAGLSRGLDKVYQGQLDDWEEMIDTNVKGLLYVTRAVVPGMVARGSGHVVNLGSTAGELTYPNGAVYCATKAAERAINDGLRQDLLGTPVRVTTVDPGMVETEFSEVRFRGDKQSAAKIYQGLTPLSAADVADAILWAATRPAHVNVARILLTPVDQANSLLIHRKP